VDRFVALAAQRLVWERGLEPRDSIHVPTAIRGKIPILDTYDDGLLKLSGKLPMDDANPSGSTLQIVTPRVPTQLGLIPETAKPAPVIKSELEEE